MKLYALPGACSLAPHIIIQELGLPHELRLLKSSNPDDMAELEKLNPTGQVPTMITDEGYTLTEGAAIMQYLDSKKPGVVFPASGQERFRAFEWMNFIATSLHRGFSPLFSPESMVDNEAYADSVRKKTVANMQQVFKVTEMRLGDGEYAFGSKFTTVDAYLFTILSWASFLKVDLSAYPKLPAYLGRVGKRPSVVAALKAEGLI